MRKIRRRNQNERRNRKERHEGEGKSRMMRGEERRSNGGN